MLNERDKELEEKKKYKDSKRDDMRREKAKTN